MQTQLLSRSTGATRLALKCAKQWTYKASFGYCAPMFYCTTQCKTTGATVRVLAQVRGFSVTPLTARDERKNKKEDKNSAKNALRFEPSGELKGAVGYGKLLESLDTTLKSFQEDLFAKLRIRVDMQSLSEIEVRLSSASASGGTERKERNSSRNSVRSSESGTRTTLQAVANVTQKSADLFIIDLESNPTLVGAVRDAVRASGLAVTDDAQRSALIVKQPPVTAELRRTLAKQCNTLANAASQRVNKLVHECERKRRNLESGKADKHSIYQDELVLLRDHLLALTKRYHTMIETIAKQKEREILQG